jgi:hypothetical protein|tara:strand:+ start:4991 stop:6433 length:1443 start_codon:yes stop_codon:yes gene_type:complete
MAYNILKGQVEFTGENGNLENTVDLNSAQSVGGVKNFTAAISASAFYNSNGAQVSPPLVTAITNAAATRVAFFNSATTIGGHANLTYADGSGLLSATLYSGSAAGLTNIRTNQFQGLISASNLVLGDGVKSDSGVLAVSGGAGIVINAGGIKPSLDTYGGLNFNVTTLMVDPGQTYDISNGGQSLASGDKMLVQDIAGANPNAPTLRSLTVGTLSTYLQNNLSFSPITIYNNPAQYRLLAGDGVSNAVTGLSALTFDGNTLALTGLLSVERSSPTAAEFTHGANNAVGAVINLVNSRAGNAGQANDFCGGVTFKAPDSGATLSQYSKVSTRISSPTDGQESGRMIFEVTTAGTSNTTYLTLDGARNSLTSSVNTLVQAKLHQSGAVYKKHNEQSVNYALTATDNVVIMNTTNGDLTASLPAAATVDGIVYMIKNSQNNNLVIDPNGAETIDGAAFISGPTGRAWTITAFQGVWLIMGSHG